MFSGSEMLFCGFLMEKWRDRGGCVAIGGRLDERAAPQPSSDSRRGSYFVPAAQWRLGAAGAEQQDRVQEPQRRGLNVTCFRRVVECVERVSQLDRTLEVPPLR